MPTKGRHDLEATILTNHIAPTLPDNARIVLRSRTLVKSSLEVDVP
jgi:hypothetical protein